jgi:hypothetical protein
LSECKNVDLQSAELIKKNIFPPTVARWFIFRPKISIWVYLGGPWNGKCHLVWFMTNWCNICMTIWYSLWSFGIHFPFWYVWTKKNLATLFPPLRRGAVESPPPTTEETRIMGREIESRRGKGWKLFTYIIKCVQLT